MIEWIARRLEAGFSRRGWLNSLFFPLSLLYGAVVLVRRLIYRVVTKYWLKRPKSPVIVIGNLFVGGTGKTPLVMALACRLREQGFYPGIISRGYVRGAISRTKQKQARLITPQDTAADVGDEPRMIASRTGLPVAVGRCRTASAALLVDAGCDVLLSDDGLQHYALYREIEIAVVDAKRGHGNGWLLPAGPLREPISRLDSVDWVVYQDGDNPASRFELTPSVCRRLGRLDDAQPLSTWQNKMVHAVAGIGNPNRFFAMLRRYGVIVIAHPFADHHNYQLSDLVFNDHLPILMTAKDAVKCTHFGLDNAWLVEVDFTADTEFFTTFSRLLIEADIQPRKHRKHQDEFLA